MRAFLWASHLGGDVPHDSQNLLIACLLHDIGLTDAFDHRRLPFEQASANVAEVLLAGAGWTAARRAAVTEAIQSHMRDDPPVNAEAESLLIRIGVGVDVSGRRFGDVEPGFATVVLARFPRLGFNAYFIELMEAQAGRKPDSAAGRLITQGLAARITDNPYSE
jgi:hypothetical protein